MEVINEISFSDHKPVLIRIKTQTKKLRTSAKPQPNIKWEALRSKEKKAEFRRRTAELIADEEIGRTRGWTEITEVLVKSAKG